MQLSFFVSLSKLSSNDDPRGVSLHFVGSLWIGFLQDGVFKDGCFNLSKGSFGITRPFKGLVFLGEVCKWLSLVAVPLNELLVEVGVSKEGLHVCNVLGRWLFFDGLDFVFLHPYSS